MDLQIHDERAKCTACQQTYKFTLASLREGGRNLQHHHHTPSSKGFGIFRTHANPLCPAQMDTHQFFGHQASAEG